jgi:hypothetical protein
MSGLSDDDSAIQNESGSIDSEERASQSSPKGRDFVGGLIPGVLPSCFTRSQLDSSPTSVLACLSLPATDRRGSSRHNSGQKSLPLGEL